MMDTAYFQHLEQKCPFCGAFGVIKEDYKECPICQAKFNDFIILDNGHDVVLNDN